MRLKTTLAALLLSFFALAATGYCADEIRMLAGSSDADQRASFPLAVLNKALEVTEPTDGPYKIVQTDHRMTRNRALEEIIKGNLINVYFAATRPEWEEHAIPIRVPLFKGLMGYRLLLVHAENLDLFEDITDLDGLKRLKAGSGSQWTITTGLRDNGFNLVTCPDYEGLFSMLNAKRFDYFLRGINEIFTEYDARRMSLPAMRIEPHLALYYPIKTYFFVSPGYPLLADRIRRGMETIDGDGTLAAMIRGRFGADIDRADLEHRIILKLADSITPPPLP